MRTLRTVLAAACAAAALTAPVASAEPDNSIVCRYLYVYDPVSGNTYLIKPCDYIPKP